MWDLSGGQTFINRHSSRALESSGRQETRLEQIEDNKSDVGYRRQHRQNNRENIMRWTQALMEFLALGDYHRVIDCNETAWKVIPEGMRSWAPVGEDGVEVCVAGSDKEAITVMASVNTAYEKLPLFIITKERTSRVKRTQRGTLKVIIEAVPPQA
jgi:hypothetical protein